jgi:neutral ceramidase
MTVILALLACVGSGEPPAFDGWPDIVPGPPVAGVAEGILDLPVGGPMGGYSSRCGYLGGDSAQDRRQSPYTVNWAESTGIQTRQLVKVIWLENGDDHLVLAKADIIYSYDGLVNGITADLEAATGLDLKGKVVLASSHTHHGIANYSDQYHFYLGGDLYNEEVYQRFKKSTVDVALEAYESREAVALGTAWSKDWDAADRVYRDRRGENRELSIQGWDDVAPGYGKDPYLHILRIDRIDGTPMAMAVTFGMHGTAEDGDNPMITTDSTGGFEAGIEEAFSSKVLVMHLQGGGGDASPAGSDSDYARLESIGEYARPLILEVYDRIAVSPDPISMETASRHITQDRDKIHVSRNGLVDWYYAPYVEGQLPDNIIYADNGDLLSPFDEFNTQYGGAFCGSDVPLIPGFSIGAEVYPYTGCVDVEAITAVLKGIFALDHVPLPMPESLEAGTTATRIGPLMTLNVDGTVTSQDLVIGFIPAEPTAMYTEQWRRRVRDEIGDEMALMVGYAQDHEGYFLIPEDWLVGGYEPEINIWGPLQGEHVMEGVLAYVDSVLGTDVHEPEDPFDDWPGTVYPVKPLPESEPDINPEAGSLVTVVSEDFWLPLDLALDLDIPAQVERVDGLIQFAWYGGDPGVDTPRVVLEREESGDWVEVTSRSGRPITDTMADILLAWTPDPLRPWQDPQLHQWWAAWQAVGHVNDRAGFPVGTYRLRVDGETYVGGSTTWPWATEPYSVISDTFEIVPATLQVVESGGGLDIWIQAPADGYRLVDIDGNSRGENPVRGQLTLDWSDGTTQVVAAQVVGSRAHVDVSFPGTASVVIVTDSYGNTGTTAL